MQGDFTRLLPDHAQRYDAVLMQQGRVQLDSDWNTAQAIDAHRDRNTIRHVVGDRGIPLAPNPDAFAIAFSPDARDLVLAPGRLYTDGLAVDNTAEEIPVEVRADGSVLLTRSRLDGFDLAPGHLVRLQSDPTQILRIATLDEAPVATTVPPPSHTGSTTLGRVHSLTRQPFCIDPSPSPAGRYRVYLEAFQRSVSHLDDSSLREVALGGPDTTLRIQTIWQLRLEPIAPTEPFGRASFGPSWRPPGIASTGKLRVTLSTPSAATTSDCILPPQSGYRGTENHLYRVEIHASGPAGAATFKWSRDNASIVTPVTPHTPGLTQLGSTVRIADPTWDFAAGDPPIHRRVEIFDARREFREAPSPLLRYTLGTDGIVALTDESGTPTAPSWADPAFSPRLRLWGAPLVTIPATGATLALEAGLNIEFSEGTYRAGDYWLIPARTAASDSPGDVAWPRSDDGTTLFKSPDGIARAYMPLAVVQIDPSGMFSNLIDCRPHFPALSDLHASDIRVDPPVCGLPAGTTVQDALAALCTRGGCTGLVLDPADAAWTAKLAAIPKGSNVSICFKSGTFSTPRALSLTNLGHVKITGAGRGTHIICEAEGGLRFSNCLSVSVHDLSVSSRRADHGGDAKGLLGTLDFRDCQDVCIRDVEAACASGHVRAAACIAAVRSMKLRDSQGSLSIQSCTLRPGHLQIGLLVVNPPTTRIHDNDIRGTDPGSPFMDALLKRKSYRALIGRLVIFGVQAFPAGSVRPGIPGRYAQSRFGVRVDLPLGEISLAFYRRVALTGVPWPRFFALARLRRPNDPAAVRLDVLRLVDDLIANDPRLSTAPEIVLAHAAGLRRANIAVASQGIVIGGEFGDSVSIRSNIIERTMQGIHVGFSRREARRSPNPPVFDAPLVIRENHVKLLWTSLAWGERHGIFVGNCASYTIDGNTIDAQMAPGLPLDPLATAIAAIGFAHRRAFIRDNHVKSTFFAGIDFFPLPERGAAESRSIWVVTHNLLTGTSVSCGTNPALRARIKGLDQNVPSPT